jgi:arylformamidase
MRIYDVSVPLAPTLAVYPGDPQVQVDPIAQLSRGDAANVSRLTCSSHSGTHLDVPRHFFAEGAPVDAIQPDVLLGPARVCALPVVRHITADDLRPLRLEGVQRVLFKTTNSALWEMPGFQPHYIALTPSAAHFLVDSGVQLVGMDYLSVDAYETQAFPVHRILLGAGIHGGSSGHGPRGGDWLHERVAPPCCG